MSSAEASTVSILVVEDDPGIAGLLYELLNDVDNWIATVAREAVAARLTFQQVPIDVLILDVELPGSSGLKLLELLVQDAGWRSQPVIVVSAQARHSEVREAIKAGQVTEAVMKPFDIDHLIHVIEGAVAS